MAAQFITGFREHHNEMAEEGGKPITQTEYFFLKLAE